MREIAAVVTMVRDDFFFLRRWVEYYGNLFGRRALYVFNHGGDAQISAIAEGCNVMSIPSFYDEKFNTIRARTFSSFAHALKQWYDFVFVTDVDEFVVIDPDAPVDLPGFLKRRKKDSMVITPIGVEIVHRSGAEPEPINGSIIGPRRYARYSSFYSKPIVIGAKNVKLSRGSHYANFPALSLFRHLYLFHMKYCDRDMSLDLLVRRGKRIEALQEERALRNEPLLPTQWSKHRDREIEHLDWLEAMPIREEWDFSERLRRMRKTWGPRQNGLYHFERYVARELHRIPERFVGVV